MGQNEALVGRVRHLSTQVAASEATLAEYVALLACQSCVCTAAYHGHWCSSAKHAATAATAEALANAQELREELMNATNLLRVAKADLLATHGKLRETEARAEEAEGRAQMAERHVHALGAAVEDGAAAEQAAASELVATDALVVQAQEELAQSQQRWARELDVVREEMEAQLDESRTDSKALAEELERSQRRIAELEEAKRARQEELEAVRVAARYSWSSPRRL